MTWNITVTFNCCVANRWLWLINIILSLKKAEEVKRKVFRDTEVREAYSCCTLSSAQLKCVFGVSFNFWWPRTVLCAALWRQRPSTAYFEGCRPWIWTKTRRSTSDQWGPNLDLGIPACDFSAWSLHVLSVSVRCVRLPTTAQRYVDQLPTVWTQTMN